MFNLMFRFLILLSFCAIKSEQSNSGVYAVHSSTSAKMETLSIKQEEEEEEEGKEEE